MVGTEVREARSNGRRLQVLAFSSSGDVVEIGTQHPGSQTFARFWGEERIDGSFACPDLQVIDKPKES